MHHHFNDIVDRIPEPPKWWDTHGFPRYCDFAPRETANIYADELVLLEIACQGCGRLFTVCIAQSPLERIRLDTDTLRPTLAEHVASGAIHYGDPPNVDCCPAGATMNSVPVRVVEFWVRGSGHSWQRDPNLEVDIDTDWAHDERP